MSPVPRPKKRERNPDINAIKTNSVTIMGVHSRSPAIADNPILTFKHTHVLTIV
jgi:hypothetical protein